MSMLDIGGVNIFGDENLDLFTVPNIHEDSPHELLLSFEGDHSNMSEEIEASGVVPPASNDIRKRSISQEITKMDTKETTEKEVQGWLGFDVEMSGNNGTTVHPNVGLLSTNQPQQVPSPNTRTKKKLRTSGEISEEDRSPTATTSPPIGKPLLKSASFVDPSTLGSDYLSSPYNSGVTSPSSSWFNSIPLKNEHFTQAPRNVPTTRRRSVPNARTPIPSSYSTYMAKESLHHPMRLDTRTDLDANYAKVQIIEMGFPQQKKDPKAFCQQVVHFICNYSKIFVGGFYLNNNQQNTWILTCTFPNANDFNQYFHYHVGERFIMQAAIEKRCFCVHSSSWENNTGLLSFLFVPIPNEGSSGNALAVMVLGTILGREEELHAHLLFLDQIRKPIASILRTLLHIQHSLCMLQKSDAIQDESKQLVAERALIALLSSLDISEELNAVICTNTKGLITFFSNGARRLLGFSPDEMINKHSLVQLHDLMELNERSKELEKEYQRPCPADFTALVTRTLSNRGADDTQAWHWIRKDRSLVLVQVTIRPLNDETSVFGFVAIGKEIHPEEHLNAEALSQQPPEVMLDESRK